MLNPQAVPFSGATLSVANPLTHRYWCVKRSQHDIWCSWYSHKLTFRDRTFSMSKYTPNRVLTLHIIYFSLLLHLLKLQRKGPFENGKNGFGSYPATVPALRSTMSFSQDLRNSSNMESPSVSHAAHAAAKSKEMPQFAAVLALLNYYKMAPLASRIRQTIETMYDEKLSHANLAPWHGCSVSPEPLNGSYNLVYLVTYEDGAQWIFKIPANGYHACFDHVAAEALKSEAQTMKFIKQQTTIPLPTVHHFDASFNNDIGCPYILMDFLKGKPLWQGWFDEKASRSGVEQFRARSMQTIAVAMVQLSQFSVDTGGFLQFDPDGRPVGITASRVPDWLSGSDMQQGLTTAREGCLYCEKGPIKDPAASFLFMLDRRGVREGDGPLDLGSHEIVRMFTEWTLEKAENANDRRGKFVLAHPDFAVQNFLVEDDGTLCGIIDWDGVAAVPLSIGCLKYPDWLMSDWHPLYNYCPGVVGQHVDSPEDLATYRTMYAQFVEASSTFACGSSKAGKLNANITRRSLIAGSLDVGAQDPELTEKMIGIIFRKLVRLTADDEDGEIPGTGVGSSIGTGTNDMDEEDSGGDPSPTDIEDSIQSDEEDDNAASPHSNSTAGLAPQSPPINVDGESDANRPLTSHTICVDGSSSGPKHEVTFPSDGIYIGKKARDSKTSGSRKTGLAKWALSLGERGSKWALDMGGKCCKRASKTFHKNEGPSDLHSKIGQQSLHVQNSFEPILRAVNPAAGICKRTETLQRQFATRIHPDHIPSNEDPEPEKTMTKRIQAWVNWLIAMLKDTFLKPISLKPIDDDESDPQTPAAAGRRLSTNVVLLNEQQCQGCEPLGEESRDREGSSDGTRSTCIYPQDVWASIAAEIDQGGIPIDLIKKRRDVIVQCVIQTLGNAIQQENDTNSHTNAYDLTTLENIEEANQELRTMLSSFADPRVPRTNLCLKSIQAMEAHRATIEEMGHEKAEPFEDDSERSESDDQKLRSVQSSLKRPEAATTDLRKEMIQIAESVDGFCESKNRYQLPATKSVFNAGSNVVSKQTPANFRGGRWFETSKGIAAVQTPSYYKQGWWFETPGGSMKRLQTQELLHGKIYDQDLISQSQLAIPDRQISKAVHSFQVPDDDESIGDYDDGGSTNDREDDRLEDGEIDEGVSGCVDSEAKSEGKGSTSRCSNEYEVKHERKVEDNGDTGKFNPYDVRVALGNGKLDDRRMRRLREGFMALLDDAVGEYRRKM